MKPLHMIHTADFHLGIGLVGISLKGDKYRKRIEDYRRNLEIIVNYAKSKPTDFLIIAGDIFDQVHPSGLVQNVFAKFIRKILDLNIQVVAIAGNHDQPKLATSETYLDAISKLKIWGFHYFRNLRVITLQGRHSNKKVKFICIPYLHAPPQEAQRKIYDEIRDRIKRELEDKDADYQVVVAHTLIAGARQGSERLLRPGGYEFILPAETLNQPGVSYVALGHVHTHQTPQKRYPNMIYPGSIERINFGEIGEEKGFISITEEDGVLKPTFIKLPCRKMKVVNINLKEYENPSQTLLQELKNTREIKDAILKIAITLRQDQLEKLSLAETIKYLESRDVFHYIFERKIIESAANKTIFMPETPIEKMLVEYVKKLELEKKLENRVIEKGMEIIKGEETAPENKS